MFVHPRVLYKVSAGWVMGTAGEKWRLLGLQGLKQPGSVVERKSPRKLCILI